MREAAHQPVAERLHALHQHHQNYHRRGHHFIIKALVAVADGEIAKPAAANDARH